MDQEIVNIEYTEEENKLWTTLYEKLVPMIYDNGCAEIVKNFDLVEKEGIFRPDKIP